MNTFIADPHWGWCIVWYFYLGGIAAGAYFLAALVEIVGDEQDRRMGRAGYFLAAPLVAVCGILLILDLDRPTRFWHMLLDATTLRPHVKYWSPMSIGAWALLVFGAISATSFVGALAEAGWCGLGRFAALATRLHRGFFGRAFDVLGTLCGFFIASYTGALLTATNQPVWCDSSWIAALFLASAATTGIAAIQLVSHFAQPNATVAREKLDRTDGWALWLELVIFGLFILSIGEATIARLVKFGVLAPLAGGALACGVIVPLMLRRWPRALGRASPIIVPVLVLVGGFLLRYAILAAPQAMLQLIDSERRATVAAIHLAANRSRAGSASGTASATRRTEPPAARRGFRVSRLTAICG